MDRLDPLLTDPRVLQALQQFQDGMTPADRAKFGSWEFCRIVDVVPHAHCYAVVGPGRTKTPAFLASGTSLMPAAGAIDISTLMPGTDVLVYFPPMHQDTVGYIIGVIPQVVRHPELVIPDWIVQQSMVGIAEDEINQQILREDKAWGVQNRSASRPCDNLPGDAGYINELGLGLFLTRFMSVLRASDDCGVWAFFFDNLLRIFGYNLEEFTSSSEHRIFNDEGEVHDIRFMAKYPWEALGKLTQGQAALREAKGKWQQGQTESYYEPEQDKMSGIWRHMRARGYLGDIERETIAVPPDALDTETYDSGATYRGLLEITKGSDGFFGIRSAKAIVLSKQVLIPIPKQTALPDDNTAGDSADNYKASGVTGDGTDPSEQKEFNWSATNEEANDRSGMLLEYLAHRFNWYNVQNVAEHAKDWDLPEESEIDLGGLKGINTDIRPSEFWANMPKVAQVKIDHRCKSSTFYESRSVIAMLDDGTVVLEGGWGEQITLTRGNIIFTAPGDVMTMPGRSAVTWAPQDIVQRAGKHVDITSTKHDVRIKGQRNLHLLGGNNGEPGGVLLESRATGRSFNFSGVVGEEVQQTGIVLKCRESDVAIWGNNVHIGARAMEGTAGILTLDADEGQAQIYMRASTIMREIDQGAVDVFNNRQNANYFSAGATILDTRTLVVRGKALFTKGSGGDSGMLVEGKGFFTEQVTTRDNPKFSGEGDNSIYFLPHTPSLIDSDIQRAKQDIDDAVKNMTDGAEDFNKAVYTDASALGNTDVIDKVGFSLRSDEQYNISNFKLYESRWQYLYRMLGYTDVWAEEQVESPEGTVTYPHPGREAWSTGQNFIQVQEKNFSATSGYAEDRSGGYDEAPPTTTPVAFDKGYLVTTPVA